MKSDTDIVILFGKFAASGYKRKGLDEFYGDSLT